jgi:hypothetical protein
MIAPKGHARMVGRWSIPPTRYGGPHDAASTATGIDPMIFGKEKEVKGYHNCNRNPLIINTVASLHLVCTRV